MNPGGQKTETKEWFFSSLSYNLFPEGWNHCPGGKLGPLLFENLNKTLKLSREGWYIFCVLCTCICRKEGVLYHYSWLEVCLRLVNAMSHCSSGTCIAGHLVQDQHETFQLIKQRIDKASTSLSIVLWGAFAGERWVAFLMHKQKEHWCNYGCWIVPTLLKIKFLYITINGSMKKFNISGILYKRFFEVEKVS